jgi:3-methyladenine DNA glycosylase AlkD
MVTAAAIRAKLRKLAEPRYARALQWFFKTGKGGYGEGDRFLGVRLPRLRGFVRECGEMPLEVLVSLLASPIHEERMFALLGMVRRFRAGDEPEQRRIYHAYLSHTRYINNWDLVDASAPGIVGEWLAARSRSPLYRLARSRSVWERRIAIIATAAFIRRGETRDTLRLAAVLLHDDHHLIHKGVGWMLRETGKRASRPALERFLSRNADRMPRTMLRYAIEHFPQARRRRYLRMKSV